MKYFDSTGAPCVNNEFFSKTARTGYDESELLRELTRLDSLLTRIGNYAQIRSLSSGGGKKRFINAGRLRGSTFYGRLNIHETMRKSVINRRRDARTAETRRRRFESSRQT